MIFTDVQFWYFFAVVFALFILNARVLRSNTTQNFLILVSSYYFYAQWDWRFLSLIAISTLVDYLSGMRMDEPGANRKRWLWLSLAVNLGILGVFKYYDFFIAEAMLFLGSMGVEAHAPTLRVILPVGISFYTFQTLTYTIDIYRGHLKPTRDLLAFAAYVAFFPQLVAGPIERARNLLPQFQNVWKFNERQATEGLRLILFGLALKVGVADNLAPIVDSIFANPAQFDGGTLILGSVYFAFQIYGDFCGYSTIAIGLAKLLGFELMTNFATPYFATSIQDFWRRWHISLSSFFRDYVYIPLGGSRVSQAKKDRNILITFTISGLWHGANWTFVFWGFYHGLLLAIQNRLPSLNMPRPAAWIANLSAMGITFALVCVGWILFRSQSMAEAFAYFQGIVFNFDIPQANRFGVVYVLLAVAIDFIWKNDTRLESVRLPGSGMQRVMVARWAAYVFMFWTVIIGTANREGVQQFIYFQF